VTESRVNHVVARLTREGYIIRVCYDGRISHRVVAPEYSSNPATSRRLIERHRRLAKNSSSELLPPKNNNSELPKIATGNCQKEQSRTAKSDGALLLRKVPTENTNRKTTTTHPDVDNEECDRKRPAEASSRCCASSVLSVGCDDLPAATSGDWLAVELAREFGLSSKQRQRVTEFFESHRQGYVRSKADVVRSEPRRNAAGALLAALRDDWQPICPGESSRGRAPGFFGRPSAQNGLAMVNRSSPRLVDAEIRATRRPGSVERPEYIPLLSANLPLPCLVPGGSLLP
jgi:hypothetical protein